MNEPFGLGPLQLSFEASHGLVIVGVLLFVKAAGLPLPIPGDLLIVGIGVLCSLGQVSLPSAFVFLSLMTIGGTSVLFVAVRRVGKPSVDHYGHYVGLTHERLHSVAARLERGGWWAIVAGRTMPGVRLATSVAAGLFRVPVLRFETAAATAALLEVGVCLLIGLLLGPLVERLWTG